MNTIDAERPQGERGVWAWALYDWANSAFATTVMAGFFPVFFKQYWSSGVEAGESTLYLGMVNSLASLIIVLISPVLGAIADSGAVRKPFLAFFGLIGVSATAGLYFVGEGQWQAAAICYALGILGFSGSIIFYDALIVAVAGAARLDRVSAFGFALGYLGGGLLFAVNVAMTLKPALFGLSGAAEAVRLSFLMVAAWWFLFALPLLFIVREPAERGHPIGLAIVGAGFRQLKRTFDEVRELKVVFTFLLAYWCYIDAVDTIIRMAVDYGIAIGFPSESLIVALLITQFVGFPAAILFGRLGERYGPKGGIFVAIGVYSLVVIWAAQMREVWEFYLLAVVVGLVQGGIQSLSRSLYARLIPVQKSAEFFGFYNMLGKFAAVVGPLLVGVVASWSGEPRLSMLSLLLLFIAGAWLLSRVDLKNGVAMARNL